MATYVLVHGVGRGGWCYRDVASILRTQGHEVQTPTLTGLGDRSHIVTPAIDLDFHITDVVNVLIWEDLHDVILVGHSYGGMVITGVADRALDRVGQLVYLDASFPRDGESLAELTPAIVGLAHTTAREVDGVELVFWPSREHTHAISDPERADWVLARLAPQPWKTMAQPLTMRREAEVDQIPRTIINCTPTLAQRTPEQTRHLDAERVWEIDTAHDLMLTAPAELAEMLLRLA
jgi:pimeloyl-ACP methyl ester carboxylesterase